MNATNLKASLTTLVNAAVTSGDLAAAPASTALTVGDLVGVLQAAEMASVQHNLDVAENNRVRMSLPGKSDLRV